MLFWQKNKSAVLSVSAGYVPPPTQVSWDKLVSLIGKEAEETDGWIFVNENLSNTVYIYLFATFHELFFFKNSSLCGNSFGGLRKAIFNQSWLKLILMLYDLLKFFNK